MPSRLRSPAVLVLLPLVGGVLLWLVVAPNLRLLAGSLHDGGGWSLAGYRTFFAGPPGLATARNLELTALWNSLLVAVGSVVLAALIGVPLALLFESCEFPGRRFFAALAMVPVLLPPLVGVVAFYFLYGESGLVTRVVQQLLHLGHRPWRLKGLGAVLLVHAYSFYVYFYAFVAAGLARLDADQLEAADTLGAGPLRRFFTVTLPLLTPALVGAALLVFMQAMASFTAPLMFDVNTLTMQLLDSRREGQMLMMNVETVVLATSCIAFMVLLRWAESRGNYLGGTKGARRERQVVTRGAWRLLLAAVGVLAVTVLLLPHAMLLLMSVADDARWTTQLLPPRYTLAAYRYLATTPSGRAPFGNSLHMSVEATVANLLWAVPAAWLLARFRFRGRGAVEAAAMLPYAIPGTVIALSLAEWFSVPQWYLGRFVWISTWGILPLAYFVRNLPLVLRAVSASLAQVDPALEEAASTLGSGPAGVLGRVVLPLVAPGAIAGGLLAMIAALGEFVASWVLYTPANRPLAIEIWNQVRNSYFGRSAAYGVVLVVAVSAMLVLAQRLGRRHGTMLM